MKLLIIEDEHKIANLIKQGLEQEHFTVDVAYDGTSGFDFASSEPYDAIILDRLLPGMDGLEICKKLREQNNHVPIIMLTAKGQVADRVEGLNSGADDYLTKPFAFEELLARIRAVLRVKNTASSTVLKVGSLALDMITHKVTRDSKTIDLSSKEYALLEYLMRNPGAVVTRTMISEHVWDINFETFTNVIDVYINYLRNKIDQGFKTKMIHTVRGRGYTLKKG